MPGDHQGEVQSDQALIAQIIGTSPFNRSLVRALDDGGLATPGLADEDGVILRRRHRMRISRSTSSLRPNDGIHFALAADLGEIVAISFEGGHFVIAGGTGGRLLFFERHGGGGSGLDIPADGSGLAPPMGGAAN